MTLAIRQNGAIHADEAGQDERPGDGGQLCNP